MYSLCTNPYAPPEWRCYGQRGEFSVPLIDGRDMSYVQCLDGEWIYSVTRCQYRPIELRLQSLDETTFINALYDIRRAEAIEHQDSTEGMSK